MIILCWTTCQSCSCFLWNHFYLLLNKSKEIINVSLIYLFIHGSTIHNKNYRRHGYLLSISQPTPLYARACVSHAWRVCLVFIENERENEDNYTSPDKINDTKFTFLLSHWMSISILCCRFTWILFGEQFGFIPILNFFIEKEEMKKKQILFSSSLWRHDSKWSSISFVSSFFFFIWCCVVKESFLTKWLYQFP